MLDHPCGRGVLLTLRSHSVQGGALCKCLCPGCPYHNHPMQGRKHNTKLRHFIVIAGTGWPCVIGRLWHTGPRAFWGGALTKASPTKYTRAHVHIFRSRVILGPENRKSSVVHTLMFLQSTSKDEDSKDSEVIRTIMMLRIVYVSSEHCARLA